MLGRESLDTPMEKSFAFVWPIDRSVDGWIDEGRKQYVSLPHIR